MKSQIVSIKLDTAGLVTMSNGGGGVAAGGGVRTFPTIPNATTSGYGHGSSPPYVMAQMHSPQMQPQPQMQSQPQIQMQMQPQMQRQPPMQMQPQQHMQPQQGFYSPGPI
jgi:hypothetical protein